MLKISGLYTSYNELLAPEGALQVAKNININTPNLAEPRKGFERLNDGHDTNTDRTKALTYYKDSLIAVHSDANDASFDRLAYYSSNVWTNLGQVDTPSTGEWRFAQSNSNLYLTTEQGIRKWSGLSLTNLTFLAGAPEGLNMTSSAASAGSGFLTSGNTVSYRIVWGYEDDSGNTIIGAPSARTNFTLTGGGTDNVDLTAVIPNIVDTSYFYRIYRSVQSSALPSDEMQLVIEARPTGGEISAGLVTYTDSLVDAGLGATLYTSASQEGIEGSNYRPPVSRDLTLFRDSMFYSNVRYKDRYKLTLANASNMAVNDTISLDPTTGSTETYTAKAAENVGNKEFQLFTAGTADENIRDTAKSLVNIINQGSSIWYAYYIGNDSNDDNLGEILIERQANTADEFYVTASNNTPWLPAAIPSSGTTYASTRDEFTNGLVWSKPFEPEAVPLPNQTRIASKDAEIQRIVALDESLMIFKEDGLYRLTGYYPDFEIELVDASVRLTGNNTIAVLSNEIYCLTQQGVMVVSGSGATRVISTPLEDEIIEKLTTNSANMKSLSFGIGHEAARRYYLFHPKNTGDTTPTQAYVYNIYTKTWSTHEISADCGLVVENEFWLGDSNSEFVIKERSSGTNRDYADYSFSTTITNVAGRVLTLNSGVDNISAGDVIFEDTTTYAVVESTDAINSTVTVGTDPGFSTTSIDVLSSIPIEMKWLPWSMGLPEVTKQIHTCAPMFKAGFAGDMTLTFETDLSPSEATVLLSGSTGLGWGLAPWGTFPWGDSPVNKPFRQWVPRSKQRCTWLTFGLRHNYSFNQWQLQGVRFSANRGSEKTGR